jgi:hypothetical protein
MSQIKLTILVCASWLDRFPVVVENCRLAGMVIERELVATGVITGSIEEDSIAMLMQVEGVDAVEPERMNRGFG